MCAVDIQPGQDLAKHNTDVILQSQLSHPDEDPEQAVRDTIFERYGIDTGGSQC